MQFLDVKTDYAFKKVFGSEDSKEKLISFLNAIIYDTSKVKIKDLTIVDPYTIPMIKGVKDTFVDVKVVLDDNSKVIIEMQVLHHTGFEKRVLYNAAKNYSIQLNKGEDYHLLNPVIALSIVDFTMFEDTQSIINRFKLLEKDTMIDYSDDIELIFIELPKFNKDETQLTNIKDEWIYFIKNAGSLEYIPTNLNTNIKDALDSVNEANLSKEELEAQHKRKEFISIQRLALMKAKNDGIEQGLEKGLEQGLEKGLEKGLEQGLKKGREEGIEQEKIEIAKKSLQQGLDIDTIVMITGLDKQVIESLNG